MHPLTGTKQTPQHIAKRLATFQKNLALGKIKPGMLGKHQSEYQKQKARTANIGNKHGLGKIFSEERRKKIGKKLQGNKHWIFRKSHLRPDMLGNQWGFKKGQKPWNKGLTASIDKRVLKNMQGVLKAVCKRPNKFEERSLAYLEILYPQRFSYTGNGTCIINGKSADAVDLENKIIALFNGVYWHLKRKGLEITEENKRLRERIEAKPFNEAGYRVIFLWEDEI